VVQARNRIEELKTLEDWNRACERNTIKEYLHVVEEHPDSEFCSEALEKIKLLRAEVEAERERRLEAARRQREMERTQWEELLIRFRDNVESDCEAIDKFMEAVKTIKKQHGPFAEFRSEAELALERGNYSKYFRNRPGRLNKTIAYLDKIIATTEGQPVHSLRGYRDAPPGPLCRAVANELRRGNIDEDVLAETK
jgi:hypothetical protein